jgi:hypothetical protein
MIGGDWKIGGVRSYLESEIVGWRDLEGLDAFSILKIWIGLDWK